VKFLNRIHASFAAAIARAIVTVIFAYRFGSSMSAGAEGAAVHLSICCGGYESRSGYTHLIRFSLLITDHGEALNKFCS
jgi:hypothetical protein